MNTFPITFSLAATIGAAHLPVASFLLPPGDYEVALIKGEFTAWSAWARTECNTDDTHCNTGWITSYRIWSPDFYGEAGNVIFVPSARCRTEDIALAQSKPARFRLSNAAPVTFFIYDSYGDNRGGLTFSLKKL